MSNKAVSRQPKLPSYNPKGYWVGGSSRTLYLLTDKRTENGVVRPGGQLDGIGPEVTVRVATRQEAEAGWQSPLSAGWVTAEQG
jgi:hypothetical protein